MRGMEDRYEKLRAYLETLSSFELPSYKELPAIGLYMEQVLDYVRDTLNPAMPEGESPLTSFMVNNYVKARIIAEPAGKRYSKDQIGYLLAISTLKKSLSMSEIALLIEMDAAVSKDKSILYGFYKVMSDDLAHEAASKLLRRVEEFHRSYEKEKERGAEDAEEALRDRLGLLALRTAIQSSIYRNMAGAILRLLDEELHGGEGTAPDLKVAKKVTKSEEAEARSLEKKREKALKRKKKEDEKIAKNKEEKKK